MAHVDEPASLADCEWAELAWEDWEAGDDAPRFWSRSELDDRLRILRTSSVTIARGPSAHREVRYVWEDDRVTVEVDDAYGEPPDGIVDRRTTFHFDREGRVVRMDELLGETTYVRNDRGDVVEVVRERADGSSRCTYERNADGTLAEERCGDRVTTYTWERGLPTSATDEDGDVREWVWRDGRLVEKSSPALEGRSWERFAYRTSGELLSVEVGADASGVTSRWTYGYDADGRVASEAVDMDADGRTDREARYTYGADGWLASAGALDRPVRYDLDGDELTVTVGATDARTVRHYRCLARPVRIPEEPDLRVRVEDPRELARPTPYPEAAP